MKQHKNIQKKIYQKPEIKKVNLDNMSTLYMVSEHTIPDSPPWVYNASDKKDPYRNQKA